MANKTIYPFGVGGQLPSGIAVVNDLTTGGADKALSAEQGVVIGEMLGAVEQKGIDAASVYRVGSTVPNPPVDDPNGKRLRIVFGVKQGEHLRVETSWSEGFYAGVWPSLVLACGSSSANASQVMLDGFTTNPLDADINVDGYLCVSLKPSTDTAITDLMKEQMLSATSIRISSDTGVSAIDGLKASAENLQFIHFPLPPFVAGAASTAGNARVDTSSLSTYPRVVIHDCVALPYAGCKLHVKVADGFVMGMRFYNGYTNSDAAYAGSWMRTGDVATPSMKYSHFMCYLAHTIDGTTADNNYTFDADEINSLVAAGEIAVLYEDCGDTAKRLLACGQQVKSMMVRYTSNKAYNQQGLMPTFVHCSDVHGDAVRWRNVVELAARIKADSVVNTGDSVACHVENGMAFIPHVVSDLTSQIPVISVVGNHDSNGDATFRASLNTNLYNNVIEPFELSAGYTMPSSSYYEDAPTYYFRDFATQKIRVISLNLYDKGQPDWNSNVISQKQIDWFVATLASTPANYGVLLAYHRSCGGVLKDDNHAKFWQVSSTAGYSPSTWALAGITGNPILSIVDAFIGKTTLSSTFTQSISGGTTQTITISADFTSLNTGVEFVAHLFGHHHRDTIGYYNSTQKQLCLNVCQTTAAYSSQYTSWANPSDLPRFGGGKEQDAFNVYTIDRDAKSVRVAKFGSTLSSETLELRDFMVIPYAD